MSTAEGTIAVQPIVVRHSSSAMLRFSRSEVRSSEPQNRIVDGIGAKAWLAAMAQPATVDNLAEIAQVLRTLGAGGADGPTVLPPQRKFAIADRIRAALLPALTSGSAEDRFTALPPDDDFARHFWAAVEAATVLRDVYAWLVSQLPKATAGGDGVASDALDGPNAAAPPVSGVSALQRALDVNAQMMVCIQRAHWAVPTPLWERHCVLGQLVRDLDCQDVEVSDALRLSATKTCRAAFTYPVMIALADPASKTGPEFEVLRMGAQRWSKKVGFRIEKRALTGEPPSRPVANVGPSVSVASYTLRFDTQSAMQSIDRRLDALAEGASPREAGIGDSLRAPVARELLTGMRQRWSAKQPPDIDSPERAWRNSTAGVTVMAMVGMPAREALQNKSKTGVRASVRSGQSPYAYQRMKEGGITQPREAVERARVDQLMEHAETWTLVAESGDAVRCVRKHARPRVGLHRLIGLRLGDAAANAPLLLGWVEALQGTTAVLDDDLIRPSVAHHVRVRLAPGLPQALLASIDDVELDAAFLLVPGGDAGGRRAGRPTPLVPMLSDPVGHAELSIDDGDGWDAARESPRGYGLVLPHASFRPQRLVKAVRSGALAMLRLEELMMRGSDFDLVRFTLL